MKIFFSVFFLFFAYFPLKAAQHTVEDLSLLNLEELMSLDVIVTSVAKKPQRLANAASAIYVLTNEDIRRSGATNLPDVLRLVPGVQVARITAHKWAISVRGFNSQYASKLQVLIDGRSIYSHLSANVIWDINNPLLEDIERIEVIRGSGATLWGANAMNGVINIITKHSKDTQGNLLVVGGGNEERMFGAARHGGALTKDGSYRLYIKSFQRDYGSSMNGAETNDLSRGFQGGFRTDFQLTGQDELTFQGDYFEGDEEEDLTSELLPKQAIDTKPIQYNILARWQHKVVEENELALQFYFNREQWNNSINNAALPDFYINTYDVDFQHRVKIFKRHDVTWGLGYRLVSDKYEEGILTRYKKWQRKHLYSSFFQNEIDLIPGFWQLIIGSKFEHNDYTGFEIQPTVRTLISWDDQTFWAAISRSTRTPSRVENGSEFYDGVAGTPITTRFVNASDLKSEKLISFEIGYRFKFNNFLSFDLSAYYNDYDRLVEIKSTTLDGAILTIDTAYAGKATVMGGELAVDWHPYESLAVKMTYSYLDDSSTVSELTNNNESSSHHRATLFISYDMSKQWEFDLIARAVDQVDEYEVDAYIAIDTRLSYKPINAFEFTFVAQNLFDSHHPEFGESTFETTPTEVDRSLYGKISWRF